MSTTVDNLFKELHESLLEGHFTGDVHEAGDWARAVMNCYSVPIVEGQFVFDDLVDAFEAWGSDDDLHTEILPAIAFAADQLDRAIREIK